MSTKYLKYLTDKPEDYSVGVSQITSTTFSALASLREAFSAVAREGTTTVAFREQTGGAQFAHILKLESEKPNDAQMRFIWQRFFCHALISKLPEQALSEAEERLAEIFEDYIVRQAAQNFTNILQPRIFMAQQGRRYSRPEIEIEE